MADAVHGLRLVERILVDPGIDGAVVEAVIGIIETLVFRRMVLQVAHVPLAEHGGVVAGCREHFSDGYLFRGQSLRLPRPEHDVNPGAHRVASGQQCQPRRGAGRLGIMSEELHALLRQAVQVGGGRAAQLAAQVGAQFAPSHVITEHIYDVGLFPEALFEFGQFFIDGPVFLLPCFGIFLHGLAERRIGLVGVTRTRDHKCQK